MFTLSARVVCDERTVTADQNDLGGITVQTSRGPRVARTVREATRIARDDLGDFLRHVQRRDIPWGLTVSVAGVSAYYGDVRYLTGGGGGGRLPDSDLVVRIRKRWHDGQGPIAALDNAIEIIRGYVADRGRGVQAA
jgi:hypothetical protein